MAHQPSRPHTIAVLNSNDDLVRLIREALHDEGYLTLAHHIADLRDGKTDIGRFLDERQPDVIIYDIAPPFRLNWQFFQILEGHPSMASRQTILTTNNSAALKSICNVSALQIVGTDDDLRQLLQAVKDSLGRRR